MADHEVTLNYGPHGVVPSLDPIKVRKGHTISFRLGKAHSWKAKIRVTFKDGRHFSRPWFEEGDPDIEVIADLAMETSYECDLVVDGKVQPKPAGGSGGGMKPLED